MQRIAVWVCGCWASVLLTAGAMAQIITAQPARPFTPAPPGGSIYPSTYPGGAPPVFRPTYQPASTPPYSPPPATSSYGSPPVYSSTYSPASLTQSPEANTIRNWYRDYLGRDPGPDLTALVNLLRGGMSATDLQATILGSNEFYSQKGRDPQTFVRQTLQSITWTEPSYADVQRWTDRLNQLQGDRFALAREILAGTQPQSPVNQISDVVSRLAPAARLAVDTINFEIGGTPQGRQANLQAQSLYDATTQLQQAAAVGYSRPSDLTLALNNADRAYQALQSTLSNPPGTAPSAAGVVRRIGSMLAEARGTSGSGLGPIGSTYPPLSTPPANPTTGLGGYNAQQLLDQVTAARRAAESLIQTLTSQSSLDYTYNVVLRDLDTLASRLAALDPLVRTGPSRDRLTWEVQSLSDSFDRIQTQLGTGRLPYAARLYWQSLQSSIAQMRDTVGAVGGSSAATTMLRPTALHESLLPLLDQAAAQIDVFVAGTTPLIYSNAEVPSVQSDARSLKNRVLLLRQQAGAGQPANVLKQTLNGMIGDYQDAFDRWNRIVSTSQMYNPARLSPIGETLNRVEQLINQALTSGELTPSGPTRAAQDLAQLNLEVNDARRVVAGLAGYREQQSIDLYLQQLSGYVQQTNDALARQTNADARRLAVGMQGVLGRMQVDIDSLNRTLAGGVAPLANQPASDLRQRADRIGRLVDDVESQLY